MGIEAPAAGRTRKREQRDVVAVAIQLATAALLLTAWQTVGGLLPNLSTFFPPVQDIAREAVRLFGNGILTKDITTTAYEVLWGFLIGGGAGILVGVALGSNRYLSGIFAPYIYYAAAIPKIILYPIFILVLGIGLESKIGVGAASAFFPIAINTMAGVAEVQPAFVKVARTLRVSTRQMYLYVYLPSAIGPVVAGVRVGLGGAIIGTLLAETKLASAGLGIKAINFYAEFEFAAMYVVIGFVFIVALLLNWGLGLLHRRVTRYQGDGSHSVML